MGFGPHGLGPTAYTERESKAVCAPCAKQSKNSSKPLALSRIVEGSELLTQGTWYMRVCVCVCVCVSPPVPKGSMPLFFTTTTQRGRGVWPSCPTTRNDAVDKKGKQGLIMPVYLLNF